MRLCNAATGNLSLSDLLKLKRHDAKGYKENTGKEIVLTSLQFAKKGYYIIRGDIG